MPFWYADTVRDESGRSIAQAVAYGPGTDGVWHSADDYESGGESFYDPQGRLVARQGALPGPDGAWFTQDDLPAAIVDYAPPSSE